jgi:hypothetical protein
MRTACSFAGNWIFAGSAHSHSYLDPELQYLFGIGENAGAGIIAKISNKKKLLILSVCFD